MALDWKYSARSYLLVPVLLLFPLIGARDLLERPAVWQQVLGALTFIGTLFLVGMLIRWLVLPVDAESLQRLRERQAQMKWDWSELRRDWEAWKQGRRRRS